jgi:hypothetical protein
LALVPGSPRTATTNAIAAKLGHRIGTVRG